jgi:hypothetical protein
MSSSSDALKIVQSFVKRSRSARITYDALVNYAEKYLARAADEDPSLEDFADNPANLMTAYLVQLEKDGRVDLSYSDGTITSVHYPDYYPALVRTVYQRIEEQPDRPFPTEDSMPITIPAEVVRPVDVKSEFVRWIGRSESGQKTDVLKLMFPDGVHSALVSTDLVPRKLAKLCVQKIRIYLRSERNAGYMRSKLASIFRQREMAMKDMLSSILTTPDQALRTVFEPTDFTFHFWTQLSSTIIKEYSQKKDKLVEEHGYCQAAYLLGYYNVHHRGVQQRSRERETALRQLDNTLRKPPYVYTISEIHGFTDQRGVPLTKKYTVEDVNHFIAEQIRPGENQSLPRMIRLRAGDGSEHYVYRDFVPAVTVEHVFTSRKEMRDHYVDSWKASLQANRRVPEMTDDAAFARSVEDRLKQTDALLHTLLDYNLLYLARQEATVAGELEAELNEIFHPKEPRLRPLNQILNLERKKLYTDARLLLPFWQAIPVLNAFVSFLKRFFLGVPEEERLTRQERKATRKGPRSTVSPATAEASSATATGTTVRYSPDGMTDAPAAGSEGGTASSGASRRAQLARFKDAVRALQKDFVRPGSTPERTLNELVERWNPLLDPVAKENLVEDVNSLSRDFLRRMKVSFRLIPPTRDRVNEWADRLVQAEAFTQIRRRDDLKEYIKLYMLVLLGK